jgi:hypothetical protein
MINKSIALLNISIILNIGIWISLGIIIAFNLHPGMPNQPIVKWTMAILFMIAGIILIVLYVYLLKRNRIAYILLIIYFSFSAMLILFDDIGWIDIIALLISIIPIVLLLRNHKYYISV